MYLHIVAPIVVFIIGVITFNRNLNDLREVLMSSNIAVKVDLMSHTWLPTESDSKFTNNLVKLGFRGIISQAKQSLT